ncbi:MAG: DUF389 domain-containing protein [Candidatus Peribacteria bacterium]|nr:MAG: DUF389 domain-containing protein [Candidatus Peribacteria bacterium]
MAASLMPPLAVIGIQLAEMNYSLVIGAFLLFFTNLISIIMVGTFFFWLYGFSPHIEKRQKFMIHIVIGVATMIILILFPLYHSFTLKQEENLVIRQLQMIQKEIGKDIDGFEMTDIVVKEIQAQKISINTTVRIPEGYDVS